MGSSGSTSSSSPETPPQYRLQIPRSYKFLQVLGEGGFGTVVKCAKRSTEEIVAIKIPKPYEDLHKEAFMLRVLMDHNLDKFNIIKYDGKFSVNGQMGLVFEMLDISLQDYLMGLDDLMRLKDIRTVMQQLATACEALDRVGVIHTDIKIDNIMMVDHVRQPFRVKLIDFGLAIFRFQAKRGSTHQPPEYRAPEIMLGLPFSEAIDIWSLGCVMAIMVFGFMLFPTRIEYDALRFITDLLGPPPQHLIKTGLKSNLFFKKTGSDLWILKTPMEYCGPTISSRDNRSYTFRSLDEVKMMRLEWDNVTEADERRECIELLKAMLKWDGKERITPSGILNHPFITRSYLNRSFHLSSCTSEALPSGVFVVQDAAAMNRIHLDETPDEVSSHGAAAPASTVDTTRIHLNNTECPPTTTPDFQISWMKATLFT
ncbi:homeodomain-interacting protein kinase 1-like isoform X2 [Trachinotus anak]|uniref:homeodomain-interacting protein kinase 1-like isoform X2 n=1 Tax=Trachinotus anak TaxID=443729 RepID=UPI0039F1BE1A